jgi:hypothetical protein
MDEATISFLKTILEIVVAVLTVFGILWKVFDGMITKKVKAQVQEAMRSVTEATSSQLSLLRSEVHKNHGEQAEKIDDRFDALTQRIDRLFTRSER